MKKGEVILEKPILFNTKMIKAILKNHITQTRRIIKLQPDFINYNISEIYESHKMKQVKIKAPYTIGDILWVRETFANTWTPDNYEGFVYKANGTPSQFPYWGNESQCKDEVWIPSIHMPRKAARIFLKVVNIRAERLQDITEEERIKVEETLKQVQCQSYKTKNNQSNYEVGFAEIWDKMLSKKNNWLYTFESNPWVWVIEFKKWRVLNV